MGEKLLLSLWPRSNRTCNIGCCPAFHLTDPNWKNIIEGSKIVKKEGMERAVEEMGVPVGTCMVTRSKVVVNSFCNVTDNVFVDYYRKLATES